MFEHGANPTQYLIFAVIFTLCWNIENIYGVTKDYQKWKHDKTNAMFVLPGAILQFVLGLVFVKVLQYENDNNMGLLHKLDFTSDKAQIIFSFIFLDLTYYIYHYLMHKVKIVWPFHAVHHSDEVLNVSTSLREHPVETCIRLGHYMLSVWFLGTALWILTLHQFIQILSKIIIHSNFRLPEKLDKYLSYVFITPNMHHVHHHYVEPYTDSNYGDLFSVWDRMFGTFTYLPPDEVVFGLDKTEGREMKFKDLMKLPFVDKTL